MNRNEMIHNVRAEIENLQRVLDLLLERSQEVEQVRRPGRPQETENRATSFNPEEFAPSKRVLSAEGKARIAAAQKKRWAAKKAAKPVPAGMKHGILARASTERAAPKTAKKIASAPAKKGAGKKVAAKRSSGLKAVATAASA